MVAELSAMVGIGYVVVSTLSFYIRLEMITPNTNCLLTTFNNVVSYGVCVYILHTHPWRSNRTHKYTRLPIRYVVWWTGNYRTNIYKAPTRTRQKRQKERRRQNKTKITIVGSCCCCCCCLHIKAALYTIVPRSPFFAFCTPKYFRLQKCG